MLKNFISVPGKSEGSQIYTRFKRWHFVKELK